MSGVDPSMRPPSPIIEDPEREENENQDNIRTRGSINRERVGNERALSQLVLDLLPLKEEKWVNIGVPQATIDTLLDARKIKSYGARARHARLIRSTLRNEDWPLVRRRLDHLRSGYSLGSPEGKESSPAQIWTEQLLVQGDAGMARFCEEYPQCDRKRLRQLVRNTVKVPDARRGKARLQLERAVDIEVGQAPTEKP